MKTLKLIGLILAFLALSNCSILTEVNQGLTGRIGFGVHSMALARGSSPAGMNMAVNVFVKNAESDFIHDMNIQFKAGSRIVYLENLQPGSYTVSEYSFSDNGSAPINKTVNPVLSVEVVANQTALFPQIVRMSEIYPGGGLSFMDNEDYWQSLIK